LRLLLQELFPFHCLVYPSISPYEALSPGLRLSSGPILTKSAFPQSFSFFSLVFLSRPPSPPPGPTQTGLVCGRLTFLPISQTQSDSRSPLPVSLFADGDLSVRSPSVLKPFVQQSANMCLERALSKRPISLLRIPSFGYLSSVPSPPQSSISCVITQEVPGYNVMVPRKSPPSDLLFSLLPLQEADFSDCHKMSSTGRT